MHNSTMKLVLIFIFFLSSNILFGKQNNTIFSGRVSRVTEKASLLRVRVDFANMKYLNKKDKVNFWDVYRPRIKCSAYIIGNSNEYLLLKIPDYESCSKHLHLTIGKYFQFGSQDLENNLKMGQELVQILLKKRLALNGQISRTKKELDSHIEKVNGINNRYEILRSKLEAEWQSELGSLEESKLNSLRNYKDLEIRLGELDLKLEKYKISDENLVLDRWALDPRLFYKK